MGASIESETTAATLGKMGVRKHSPMANLDFLVIPLGAYVDNHLKFGASLDRAPKVFATNYFLTEEGQLLNEKVDKKVWLMWMDGRVHDEFQAIETPVGLIPKYEDLKELFQQIFERDYSREDYERQFAIRTKMLLGRLDRIEEIYGKETDVPQAFLDQIAQQRARLEKEGRRALREAERELKRALGRLKKQDDRPAAEEARNSMEKIRRAMQDYTPPPRRPKVEAAALFVGGQVFVRTLRAWGIAR